MDEIVRVSIVAIIAYITLKWVNSPYDIPSATTLTERAKTVCFPLGKMDVSTMDSIYRWVYGILSFAYFQRPAHWVCNALVLSSSKSAVASDAIRNAIGAPGCRPYSIMRAQLVKLS